MKFLQTIPLSNLCFYTQRAMRLNYLQNGGHDQNVLNRFTEMEYNARFKQTNNARIPSVPRFGKNTKNKSI